MVLLSEIIASRFAKTIIISALVQKSSEEFHYRNNWCSLLTRRRLEGKNHQCKSKIIWLAYKIRNEIRKKRLLSLALKDGLSNAHIQYLSNKNLDKLCIF